MIHAFKRNVSQEQLQRLKITDGESSKTSGKTKKIIDEAPAVGGEGDGREGPISLIYDVEENKKENCKPDLNLEFKPSKELICTLDHFGPSMGVSFDFKVDTFDMPGSGDWRGMLHFREKAAKGWYGPVGTRVPAFYINVKTKVVIIFAVSPHIYSQFPGCQDFLCSQQ